ncbi:Ancient ubiquitous protein 1 [Varanus komodoensis]|nr:Ancient ubiquitous protein 1 [Varanus komodoensis]
MEHAAAPVPSVGPERLFDSQRLPSDGLLLLSLLLYAPVGLFLLLLRLFLGLHVFLVSCALPDSAPRRFVVRVMCSLLGLVVRQSRPAGRQQQQPGPRSLRAQVYIANHVTRFDHNVLNLLTSCNAPLLNGASGFICWSRGFLEVGGTESRAELLQSLKGYSSQEGNPPLLLFPEETTTNGRVGLLRFRWLPSVCRAADETREEFALRVQELLASELGVAPTRLTAADKAEHLKRLRHRPAASHSPPAHSPPPAARSPDSSGVAPAEDMHVAGMAQRVREVLPHVPLAVICKDLAQTKCVDTTIANILEGRVPFVPHEVETEPFVPVPSVSSAQHPPASPPSLVPAKLFARSPEARHLSLQERKRALYDYARRRYTEKYGTAHGKGGR